MKHLAAMLFALAAAPFAQAGELSVLENLNAQSRFYGVGWQSDTQHWSVELLTFGTDAQIAYPSAECSGTWTLSHATDDYLEYFEVITEGLDVCIESGIVRLEPLEDGQYIYSYSEHGAPVMARAILMPHADKRLSYMDLLRHTINGVDLDYMLPEFNE